MAVSFSGRAWHYDLAESGTQSSSSDSVTLGKLSLQHTPQNDHMLYLSVAQGCKGGAFDSVGFNDDKPPTRLRRKSL